MNIVLWIVAALLALAFLTAGSTKLLRSKEQLASRMTWVEDFDPQSIRAIALLEILGAAGLILPAAPRILPMLTRTAAFGLAVVMIGAITTHARRREYMMVLGNLILFLLATLVAYGRFAIIPL